MAGGTVALVLGGRILGLVQLYSLAAAAGAAVVAALLYVRTVRVTLDGRRRVRPARVHLGADCRVELALTNRGRTRTPPLMAVEPFGDGSSAARLRVPPLGPGQSARASYRVPTDRRGRFRLGPLRLVLEDPFSLARASVPAAPAGSVIVFPRIERLGGLPPAPGNDPHSGTVERAGRLPGEEFYALRPYQVGDDLRRVHWPSTARTGELMIRQLELPWQHRATVVLDVRPSVHSAASLETAVSAAASILTGSHRAGAQIRLVTTGGADSDFGSDHAHWEALLATLAPVRLSAAADLRRTLTRLVRRGAGSAVAVVSTSALSAPEARAVARLHEAAGLVVLVSVEEDGRGAALGVPARLPVVRVGPDRPISVSWQRWVRAGVAR